MHKELVSSFDYLLLLILLFLFTSTREVPYIDVVIAGLLLRHDYYLDKDYLQIETKVQEITVHE